MNTDNLWNVRNEIMRELAAASWELDRLQVELCEDTPYEIPTSKECRQRILSAMDNLRKLYDEVTNLGNEIRAIEV